MKGYVLNCLIYFVVIDCLYNNGKVSGGKTSDASISEGEGTTGTSIAASIQEEEDEEDTDTDWNYDYTSDGNPYYWGQMYDSCAGSEQSPVNIDSDEVVDGFERFETELSDVGITQTGTKTIFSAWDWNSKYVHHFQATNNGHTIKLTPIDTSGANMNTKTSGHIATLKNIFDDSVDFESDEFCLHSIHFHWGEFSNEGSEHTRYGTQYPAEIHFVHYNCDYDSLTDAVDAATGDESYGQEGAKTKDRRPLAIVAMFFELDESAKAFETAALTKIVNHIDKLKDAGSTTTLSDVNLQGNLVPTKPTLLEDTKFWYYKGSLTTPECYEIVHWHVLDTKLKITTSHLNKFRKIHDSDGSDLTHNWRPIQNNAKDVYQFEFIQQVTTTTTTTASALVANSDDPCDSDSGLPCYASWGWWKSLLNRICPEITLQQQMDLYYNWWSTWMTAKTSDTESEADYADN